MYSQFGKRRPKVWLERVGQKNQIIESDLSWTIVQPPGLVDKPMTNKVVAGTEVKLGSLSSITLIEVSAFIINEVLSSSFNQKTVFVKIKSGKAVNQATKRQTPNGLARFQLIFS